MALEAKPNPTQGSRPRVLFVDDEERVLNSMRIMFRRNYDLHTATHGSEALKIIRERDIDVIVADHRMPQMTGVEVLTEVRKLSPRTVRILLTGYADLDAVERSINEGEVFRFLTKPCAPQQLRDTIALAAHLSQTAAAVPDAEPETVDRMLSESAADSDEDGVEIVLESDTIRTLRAGVLQAREARTGNADGLHDPTKTDIITRPPTLDRAEPDASAAPRRRLARGMGVIVFSNDEQVTNTVQQAVRGRLPVYCATNIVQVIKLLTEHRPGVLLTDISIDKATIQVMTARLKEHLPELVTIAVAEHRDVLDMVWLINHGQIFRFLRKPLSPGRCTVSLQAALQHHRTLLKNPGLAQRHQVDTTTDTGLVDGLLTRLRNVRRLWASV
jgi:DNA-binding NtrC family response regulator